MTLMTLLFRFITNIVRMNMMLHQALVDIITTREIPQIDAERLDKSTGLLFSLGLIDDEARWAARLNQPWIKEALTLAQEARKPNLIKPP